MGFIIFGAILIIVGVVFWIMRGKKATKLHVLEINETSKTNEVIENYKSMAEVHGPGAFSIYAELKGKAIASTPEIGEFSKKECAYYRANVTREYEELETKTDSNGHTTKRWVKKTQNVSSHTNTSPDFAIKDDTGEILVDPTGAEMHTIKSFSKFEKGDTPQGGGLNISIGGFNISSGASIRTIGYRYEEHSIPLNTDLYVIGDVNDRSGRLMVSKPKEKTSPYIVSTKSEDELTDSLGKSVQWMKITSFIGFGLGGALLIYGIIDLIMS